MEYATRQIKDVTLIHIKGRLDNKSARDFESALRPYLNKCMLGETIKILVDLGGVDFMTSAGLRVLMMAAKTCGGHKGEITVAALQPVLQEVFRISRSDLLLKIFPTVPSALEDMSPAAAAEYKSA